MGGNHHHHHHNDEKRNILVAFFLNATFAVIELIGGYYTNSVAITSDALHDFGDSLALLFSYFSEKIGSKDPDKNYTFGYRRFSVLAALINGTILFLGSLFVIYEAIQRIQSPEEVKPEGMVFLAVLGIIVNSVAAYKLSKNSGLNAKMVMYHLLEDLLGWVAVLVVSIVLLFKPWYVLDSVLSILISLIILKGVYKKLLKVGMIFLQKFPEDLEITEITKNIESLGLVNDIHAIKGWSIDGQTYYLRFHVRVPADTVVKDLDLLKMNIKEILKSYDVKFSTIEFESSKCEIK